MKKVQQHPVPICWPHSKERGLHGDEARTIKLLDIKEQVAQLSQRDRAAGWVSYGQKWKTGTERQYFTDIIGLFSTTMT